MKTQGHIIAGEYREHPLQTTFVGLLRSIPFVKADLTQARLLCEKQRQWWLWYLDHPKKGTLKEKQATDKSMRESRNRARRAYRSVERVYLALVTLADKGVDELTPRQRGVLNIK